MGDGDLIRFFAGMCCGASIASGIAAMVMGARDPQGYWITACIILAVLCGTTLTAAHDKKVDPRKYTYN